MKSGQLKCTAYSDNHVSSKTHGQNLNRKKGEGSRGEAAHNSKCERHNFRNNHFKKK